MNHHAPRHILSTCLASSLLAASARADNPLILDQFTADPSAKVFGDRIYIYPSHDIPPSPGKGRPDWFCMEDYHVFSSENLIDWVDHGVIVDQKTVPWVDPSAYSMWAPDCASKNGKYFFYFPARPKSGRGFKIGVAIADSPTGPFTPRPAPLAGVNGIDPNVFIDRDGKAYLYYSLNKIYVAPLKDTLVEVDAPPTVIETLPKQGLIEGPFLFERNGTYYLTYPHVEKDTERLEYATARNPLGPFTVQGVLMDETPGCWTNHPSVAEFKGTWYLFYHANDLSPQFDKNRSIRAEALTFNPDGTLQKVTPTPRGVGIANARSHVQVDRYSALSANNAVVDFLDLQDTHKGWKVTLSAKDAWVRYDRVDFGGVGPKSTLLMASAPAGSRVDLLLDSLDGPRLASPDIPPAADWQVLTVNLEKAPSGVHNIILVLSGSNAAGIDWVSFK